MALKTIKAVTIPNPKVPLYLLLEHMRKAKGRNRYLDVVTGTGQILFQLASHFKEAEGIDISDLMLENAAKEAEHHPNVKIYKCAAEDISRGDKALFDFITVSQALHFFKVRETLERIKK